MKCVTTIKSTHIIMGAGASAQPGVTNKQITIKQLYDIMAQCVEKDCNYASVNKDGTWSLEPRPYDETPLNTARSESSASSTASMSSTVSNTTASNGYAPGNIMLDGQLLRNIVFNADCPSYTDTGVLSIGQKCPPGIPGQLIRISYSEANQNYNVTFTNPPKTNVGNSMLYQSKSTNATNATNANTCGKTPSKNGYCTVDRLPGDLVLRYYAEEQASAAVPAINKPPDKFYPQPPVDLSGYKTEGRQNTLPKYGNNEPVNWTGPSAEKKGGKKTRKYKSSRKNKSKRQRKSHRRHK